VGGSCGAVDFPAAPHDVVGSPAGLSRLSGDEGTTEGAQLEAAIGWDRGGETRRHGNQSWALARMSSLVASSSFRRSSDAASFFSRD